MAKGLRSFLLASGLGLGLTVFGGSVALAGPSSGAGSDPQPQPTSYSRYVSMGDSVAAGAGLPVPLGVDEDRICARSNFAYPSLVAAELSMSHSQMACSGAKLDDGIFEEQRRKGVDIASQLDRAFEGGTPELITMTVGANDARWVQFLYQCYLTRCDNSATTAAMELFLTDMRLEMNWVLNRIEEKSAGDMPTVLVTGYYNPLSERDCVETERVTDGEWTWINERATDLNGDIERAVDRHDFAHFVPIDFSDHGLCAEDSWAQGITESVPFHPTIDGQAAIAEAVVDTYYKVEADTDEPTRTPEPPSTETPAETDSTRNSGFSLRTIVDWLRRGDAEVRG